MSDQHRGNPPSSAQHRLQHKRQNYPLRTYLEAVPAVAQAEVLVCLTLYNEPMQALADTLVGLGKNQQRLNQADPHAPAKLLVCILLDGEDRLHPDTRTYLDRHALAPWPGPPASRQGDNSLNIRARELSLAVLLDDPNAHGSLSVMLASKRDNAGKLDSHAWLFWGVCAKFQARYVLQIDAGSVPAQACIAQLLGHMRQRPDCLAVTTHILAPPPQRMSAAHNWEYADYIWEKVSDWAVGDALDYLEVVPGQCSLIDRERFTRVDAQGHAAVDAYLRGLEPQGLLEHNLFLAEDRVLGFELASHGRGGSVHYASNAGLRTDPAPTFSELVR
jgi:hypothetical protein